MQSLKAKAEFISLLCQLQYYFLYQMNQEDEIKNRFCSLMADSDFSSFFKGKQIIESILKNKPFLPQQFHEAIFRQNFYKIKNVLLMLYLYSMDIQFPIGSFRDRYVQKFNEISRQSYPLIIIWLQQLQKAERIIVFQFLVEYLPKFFIEKLNSNIQQIDLELLLFIFNNFKINSQRQAKLADEFMTKIKKFSFSNSIHKEKLIIKTIINILAYRKAGEGNMSIILDEYILGPQQDEVIDKFCVSHADLLLSYQIWMLLKVFKQLVKKAINWYVVDFIAKTSHMLVLEQEFFKLKMIYAEIILPILAKRGKYCAKEKVEEAILELCQFYTKGFAEHCRIGTSGVYCLLQGIELITSERYRKRWAKLCLLIKNESTDLQQLMEQSLKEKGIDRYYIEQCKQERMRETSDWPITTRNIREHKVYKMVPSKLKGIKNKRFQCFINSVVQALFHTHKIMPLIRKIPSNRCRKSVSCLMQILQMLERGEGPIKVDELQESGPQFAKNDQQQDAQQYLLAILNELQQNFKSLHLLDQFKRIFQIQSQVLIKCKNCKYESGSIQTSYIHTICYKEIMKLQSSEDLVDFICEQCNNKNCTKNISLILNCQIFIVHINRFSNQWGEVRKQLPTQKILRKFGRYQLVGMIFHIGRSVQAGHYVYYCRREKKKWARLNDEITEQFCIQVEDQEFQRQMKAQVTPYILFYERL